MLLEECEEYFHSRNLYEVFGIQKEATAAEVKKAYYRQSMTHHPDKSGVSEDEKKLATAKFQLITKIYKLLADKEARELYDSTGQIISEEVLESEDFVGEWRKVFKKVTQEDIDNFMRTWIGSEEEIKDVKKFYNKFSGDVAKILEHVIGSEEARLVEIIKKLIADGELKETAKFKSSTSEKKASARGKKAKKEAVEAEKVLAEMTQQEGGSSLEMMIRKRQNERAAKSGSFLDDLEAKYSKKAKKSK